MKQNSQTFTIQGLNGAKKLSGVINIRGAKNAALKAMAAAVLFDGPVELRNIPHNADIETMSLILRKLGAQVIWGKKHGNVLVIDPTTIDSTDIDPELAAGMRASVVLTGPMLARFGKVSFPAPGGCVIGARPINLFIEGYKKMGATIELKNGLYHISAPKGGLKGTSIFFNIISVGGTETLMMAAALGKGKTFLENCAMEPEIVNVAEWLISCGAKISGVGTPMIVITGTNSKALKPKKAYTAIPDRIEAGSYLLLGALCAKDLTIKDCTPRHLYSLISLLESSGVPIIAKGSTVEIKNNIKPNSSFKAFNVQTHEYPGFPTDLQSQIVAFLSQVSGESKVLETIFEGRFKYVEELEKLGAGVTVLNPREIEIKGPASLKQLPDDEELQAHDIRAGFAVVMAALVGKGEFVVNNVHLIDRGYEDLEVRLRDLGADVKRR